MMFGLRGGGTEPEVETVLLRIRKKFLHRDSSAERRGRLNIPSHPLSISESALVDEETE